MAKTSHASPFHTIVTLDPDDATMLRLDWPYIERLNLLEVEAWMLFPSGTNAERNRKAYEALGIHMVLTEMLGDTAFEPAKVFLGVTRHVLRRFGNVDNLPDGDVNDQDVSFRAVLRDAWSAYQTHLRDANFPLKGKGSITERYVRGSLAGSLLSVVLLGNISLEKAAGYLCSDIDALKKQCPSEIAQGIAQYYPTVTAQNLIQNIWPEFKPVAHLHMALQDFSGGFFKESYTGPMLFLSDLQEIDKQVLPSRWSGWRNFLHKANYILRNCVEGGPRKQSSKSLLSYEHCVRWLLSDR